MFSAEVRGLGRATAMATGAAGLCWLVAHAGGRDLAVTGRAASLPTPVPWGAVLLATAAGGVAAHVLVRLANRTTRPRRTFAVAVAAGLVLSCLPPVLAATTTGTAVVLLAMHLLVAGIIVPPAARLLRPSAPPGPRRTGWSRPAGVPG